ncbi:DUF1376 domain-containing protein [Herbaspirillum sp.]|uniref:YdaU family protein n=1 Tax=Herbaspirillum sp. TaxID=1890675 RepID=UPI003388A510|nr:YdaU family protein [Herbaspirillum sp.]
MSLPYFPMFPTDFEAKTSHLTLEEDGAYNRLLRRMWMTPGCSLPDDDAWIMRRMRCDQDTFDRVVSGIIDEFCKREKGRVSNARLTRVFDESNAAHKRRVSAGARGGKAKVLKAKGIGPSIAGAMSKQPEPEPELDKRKRTPSGVPKPKRGTRLPDDWVLPKDYGEWAISEGWPEGSIQEQANRFRDYWVSVPGQKATKLDWKATWRNWLRNAGKPRLVTEKRHENRSGEKSRDRVSAFIAGARGDPRMDRG